MVGKITKRVLCVPLGLLGLMEQWVSSKNKKILIKSIKFNDWIWSCEWLNGGEILIGLGGKNSEHTHARILKSRDFGITWKMVWESKAYLEVTLLFKDSKGGVFAGVHGGDKRKGILLKSADCGETWHQVHQTYRAGNSFFSWHHMCEDKDGTLFLAEYGARPSHRIYKSTDGGDNWTEIFTDTAADHFHFIGSSFNGHLYAATGDISRQLYKSTDEGNTWKEIPFFKKMALTSFLNTEHYRFFGTDTRTGEIYRTNDDSMFEKVHQGLPKLGGNVWRIIKSPKGTIYAAIAQSRYRKPLILASGDGGNTWSPVFIGYRKYIKCISLHYGSILVQDTGTKKGNPSSYLHIIRDIPSHEIDSVALSKISRTSIELSHFIYDGDKY